MTGFPVADPAGATVWASALLKAVAPKMETTQTDNRLVRITMTRISGLMDSQKDTSDVMLFVTVTTWSSFNLKSAMVS